jgi:hypothetical protein
MSKEERDDFERKATEYLEWILKLSKGNIRYDDVRALIKHKDRYYLCTLGEPDEGGWHHARCELLPIPISLEF